MQYQLLVREHFTDAVRTVCETRKRKIKKKQTTKEDTQLHASAYTISITITSGKYY